MALRINSPRIIHEIIDNEAIVVDLDLGTYYSLDGVAADIWTFLRRGAGRGEIIAALEGLYQAGAGEIETAVDAFLEDLQMREIVVDAPDDAEIRLEKSSSVGPKALFTPPALHAYHDMQELLLLDPIHEVDEKGWPNAKPAPGGK